MVIHYPYYRTFIYRSYSGPYTGVEDNLEWILANGPWYAQKVVGNVWQADYATVTSANISFIDWGDAIESVDPKINRPYRLELALYSNQYSPMTAYTMTELAFPSSPQETQGTNTTTYESNYAAVASPLGRLAVSEVRRGCQLSSLGMVRSGRR